MAVAVPSFWDQRLVAAPCGVLQLVQEFAESEPQHAGHPEPGEVTGGESQGTTDGEGEEEDEGADEDAGPAPTGAQEDPGGGRGETRTEGKGEIRGKSELKVVKS